MRVEEATLTQNINMKLFFFQLNPLCVASSLIGYLSVCLNGSWKELWCVLRGERLYLQKEPGDQRPPVVVVPLKGAEVVPGGLGPKHPFSFRILQSGNELASLEVNLHMIWIKYLFYYNFHL